MYLIFFNSGFKSTFNAEEKLKFFNPLSDLKLKNQ